MTSSPQKKMKLSLEANDLQLGEWIAAGTFGDIYKVPKSSDTEQQEVVKMGVDAEELAVNFQLHNFFGGARTPFGPFCIGRAVPRGLLMPYEGICVYTKMKDFPLNSKRVELLKSVFLYARRSLSHLHLLGYCHLDIKTSNFVMNVEGSTLYSFKMIDFGHAEPLRMGKALQCLSTPVYYWHPCRFYVPEDIQSEDRCPRIHMCTEELDMFSYSMFMFDLMCPGAAGEKGRFYDRTLYKGCPCRIEDSIMAATTSCISDMRCEYTRMNDLTKADIRYLTQEGDRLLHIARRSLKSEITIIVT